MSAKAIEDKVTRLFARLRAGSPGLEDLDQAVQLPVSSPSCTDTELEILHLDLFLNDFDKYFAVSMFHYYLALTVQKDFNGYRFIDPKYVLEHIESGYKFDATGAGISLGDKFFHRIKAARATKSTGALEAFLTELQNDIADHCSAIRRELAAELDASGESALGSTATSPKRTHCTSSTVPTFNGGDTLDFESSVSDGLISTSNNSGSITNSAISDLKTFEGQGDSSSPRTGMRSPSPPLSTDNDEIVELHQYSQVLQSHSLYTKTALKVVPSETQSLRGWSCTVIYGHISRVATAKTKKMARHLAARSICLYLGITL